MKTKLVTSFYTGISDYPFYGHESFSRHERYLHSLRTLNNIGVEIVCLTHFPNSSEPSWYFEILLFGILKLNKFSKFENNEFKSLS